MDTENRLTAVREEGFGGWVRRVKRLSRVKKRLMDTYSGMLNGGYQRKRGWGKREQGKRELNGDGRRLDQGW